MSDAVSETASEQVPDGIDPLLWAFVGLAESGVGATITVQIGGGITTGEIISGKRYFEGLATGFAKASVRSEDTALPGEAAKTVIDGFARSLAALAPKVGRTPYLHLKDATVRLDRGGAAIFKAEV
jgi:hypothetical protein